MRRDDIPEQNVVRKPELGEHAVHDRRGRFGRARAGDLTLGGEGEPRNPAAAITGRFSHEEDLRAALRFQVCD